MELGRSDSSYFLIIEATMKRREFIKNTSVALTGIPLVNTLSATYSPLKERLNLGVIGTGGRGNGLIPLINAIEGMDVKACCDVLPDQLEKALKKTTGKVIAYTDYRKLLADKTIDAVLIATPFSTHAKIALDAMEAGKHIYCEKTMAKGYSDIKELVNKSSDSQVIFQTGHQFHSSRLYTRVGELI